MVGLGWYLDVIGSDYHVLFWVLRIFGEKSQKEENWKSGQKGLLHRSVGTHVTAWDASPWRGQGAQKGTPQLCHGVALLRRYGGLRRNVAVLRRGVATVHTSHFQIFVS